HGGSTVGGDGAGLAPPPVLCCLEGAVLSDWWPLVVLPPTATATLAAEELNTLLLGEHCANEAWLRHLLVDFGLVLEALYPIPWHSQPLGVNANDAHADPWVSPAPASELHAAVRLDCTTANDNLASNTTVKGDADEDNSTYSTASCNAADDTSLTASHPDAVPPSPAPPASTHEAIPATPASTHEAIPATPASTHEAIPATPASTHEAIPATPASTHEAIPATPASPPSWRSHNDSRFAAVSPPRSEPAQRSGPSAVVEELQFFGFSASADATVDSMLQTPTTTSSASVASGPNSAASTATTTAAINSIPAAVPLGVSSVDTAAGVATSSAPAATALSAVAGGTGVNLHEGAAVASDSLGGGLDAPAGSADACLTDDGHGEGAGSVISRVAAVSAAAVPAPSYTVGDRSGAEGLRRIQRRQQAERDEEQREQRRREQQQQLELRARALLAFFLKWGFYNCSLVVVEYLSTRGSCVTDVNTAVTDRPAAATATAVSMPPLPRPHDVAAAVSAADPTAYVNLPEGRLRVATAAAETKKNDDYGFGSQDAHPDLCAARNRKSGVTAASISSSSGCDSNRFHQQQQLSPSLPPVASCSSGAVVERRLGNGAGSAAVSVAADATCTAMGVAYAAERGPPA
ncbi:hypothetical protein Agub_g7093, partial [Astrephomene gubernaculifera]